MRLEICRQSGKVTFLTRWHAERVAKVMSEKQRHNTGSVYKCIFCKQYHITHYAYDERIDIEQKRIPHIPKKVLRSIRRRMTQILHETMKTIRPLVKCDNKKLAKQISQAAGEVKMFVGGTANASTIVLADAMDLLRHHPLFRGKAKQLFNRAAQELKTWRTRLLHPSESDLRFFDLNDMEEACRQRYGENVTTEQYFEFWEGIGGQMYMKTLPFINALTYKLERHFQRMNKPDAHAIALAVTVDNLLFMSRETYRIICEDCQEELPSMTVTLKEMFEPLSIHRVSKLWHDACELLTAGCDIVGDEKRDVELSIGQIMEMWSDPVVYCDIQTEAIDDFKDDIFRTKSEYRRVRQMNQRKRSDVVDECERIKRQQMLEKLSK